MTIKPITEHTETGIDFIADLRALAELLDRSPTLAHYVALSISRIHIFPPVERWPDALVELGTFTKGADDMYLEARKSMGRIIELVVNQQKANTCERREVGVRTVTREVPVDPDVVVETRLVEVEEPVYEWVCPDSWLETKADAS